MIIHKDLVTIIDVVLIMHVIIHVLSPLKYSNEYISMFQKLLIFFIRAYFGYSLNQKKNGLRIKEFIKARNLIFNKQCFPYA